MLGTIPTNFRAGHYVVRDDTIRDREKVESCFTADQFPVEKSVLKNFFEQISKLSVAKCSGLVL